MFATLVFYAYLLIVLLGLTWLWQWLKGYLRTFAMPPERRLLFSALILILVGIIALAYAVKLYHWSTAASLPSTANADLPLQADAAPLTPSAPEETPLDATPAQPVDPEQQDFQLLAAHEQQYYPELYRQRQALRETIQQSQLSLNKLQDLARQAPKQVPLLQAIYVLRSQNHQKLSKDYQLLSQHLLTFWTHYNAGDRGNAERKFRPIAEQLTRSIQQSLGDQLNSRRTEAEQVERQFRLLSERLRTTRLPLREEKISTYSENKRLALLKWISTVGAPGHYAEISSLAEQRNHIHQRAQQINTYLARGYSQQYPELRNALNRTLNLWQQALQHNYYAEYRLLYAYEMLFVLQSLEALDGEQTASTGRRKLERELASQLPKLMQQVSNTLAQAEDAYTPRTVK